MKFAIVVHTCDRYEFLYQGFLFFFKKNFPELNCECYFLTEEIAKKFNGFTTIPTGKGEWSDRLRRGLLQIPEAEILYLQEDFWLFDPAPAKFFQELELWKNKNAWDLIKLHRAQGYIVRSMNVSIDGFTLGQLENQSDYLMSHQASVWKKSAFLEQLKYAEHPWRNEREATKRMRGLNLAIYQLDFFNNNDHPSHQQNTHSGHRYYTVSDRAMLNQFTPRFFNLLAKDPAMNEYYQAIKNHYELGLTHDGGKVANNKLEKLRNFLSNLFSN